MSHDQGMFGVGETEEGAILSMPFLVGHKCVVDVGRPLLRVGGHVIVYA